QVTGSRFFGFNSAKRIVVTPVDPAGKKRYAGTEMGNHKVKLGKPFEYSGIGEPCRRQHDIELKTQDDRNPPFLHHLGTHRSRGMNKDRHTDLLRPFIY